MTRLVKTKENISGLPNGFTEVEYLQSTGTQYINTGYKYTSGKTQSFNGNIMWTDKNATANFFYGYRSVNSATYQGDMRAFFIYGSTATPIGRLAIRYGVNTDNSTSVAVSLNTRCNISFDGSNLKVNGTTYATLTQAYTPANYQNMWLFWCNCTGYYSADVGKFIGRIYNWQMFEDGILVRDFIPCLDNNGRPCMYDLVGKKPYYNIGTGEFTYGRKIIPVEYLQSDGNQYIDIGIKYKPSLSIKGKLTRTEMGVSGSVILLSTSTTNPVLYFPALNANSKQDRYVWRRGGYSEQSYYYSFDAYPVTEEVYLDAINDKLYLNGSLVKSGMIAGMNGYSSPYESASNLYLYGIGNTYCGVGKIYYCQIWDNTELVRDYLPAKDENGVGFMFDRATHSCYLNNGTGTFSYGNPIYTTKTRLVKEPLLPNGFKRVEYLESSGTQYIDTGIAGSSTLTLEMIAQKSGSGYGVYFGAGTGNNRIQAIYFSDYNNARIGNINSNLGPDSEKFNVVVDALNKNVIYNGTSYPFAYTSALTNLNIFIFTRNEGSSYADKATAKCWSFKIFDNGIIVRDFIPCLDANSTPCLYDTVTQTAFYNQGSGSFTYGNILPYETKTRLIPSWLDDYTFVNYIQSTGTQYINTGVTLTNNHSVEIDYQLTQASQSRAGLFGNLNMTGSNQGRFGSLLSPSNQQLEHGYGTGNDYWQQGYPNTNRHKLYQNKNKIYFDGTLIHTFTSATFTLNTTAPLGSFGYTNYTPAKAKYYNSKWWDGDTLIRNFIPAIRKSDSAVGMLDIVNRVFYTNQGTGVFSYG